MNHKFLSEHLVFYIFVFIGFLAVLYTNPFLRYPYDMIHHLIVIDDIYMQLVNPTKKFIGIWANDIYIMMPTGEYESLKLLSPRYIWHNVWSEFFVWLHIDSTQMILRAKIIHVIQIYVTLFSIYFFSKVVIRNIFKEIPLNTLNYLSLWSTVIWLTIFATSSAYYHQIWIMWYSINYQITLPLFWYIVALTLVLLVEDTSWKKKLFFILQILLISRFILQAHSMEFMYYLMYIFVFCIIFINKLWIYFKKYFYLLIPIILSVIYFIKNYQPDNSLILNYLTPEQLPVLYKKIMQEGEVLLNGYNRASSSINEIMYLIAILSCIFLLNLILKTYKKHTLNINIRLILFISITSIFLLIPLYQFSAGLFSIITRIDVVNRLYYSSSLFVVLPIIIYYFSTIYHIKLRYINLTILVLLVFTAIISKHNNTLTHNYYKNIMSIKNSFNERKVGFNLSQKEIAFIGDKLTFYEKEHKITKLKHTKEIYYYARADIAFVIKYIYKRKVYWKGRRANPNYVDIYKRQKNHIDLIHQQFEIPKNFPNYHPYL